jgi:hypothetical protein
MSANPLRAERELRLGDEVLKLTLDVNAFCCVEPVLGMKPMAILREFQEEPDGLTIPRAMLWAALQKHHPETHLAQAGEIMSDVGFLETRKSLTDLFGQFYGQAEDGDEKDPPKKRKTPGTG